MKHYIYIMLSTAALLTVAGACVKEKPSDKETMDQRVAATTALEVTYASEGQPVSSLAFNSKGSRYQLDVNVNNDNLRWNLESNRDWCVVIPEEHHGSGKVTLAIEVNESFEDRTPATLTFVAGEYRGATITVNQSASSFIVGQPYFIAPMAGGQYTTKIVTEPGSSWECEGNAWLEVTKGSTTTAGGYDITDIIIKPSANTSESRYGAVTLTQDDEKFQIHVWQFGSDYDYDELGNLFFNGRVPARIKITAPAYTVQDVLTPDFGQYGIMENGDGTSTVTVTLDDNLSDCSEVRVVNLSLSLNNSSASVVDLPVLVQDYLPAHGLVTAKGLKAFAQAVATGADTSEWERDGEIVMIQDIAMDGETIWEGIGTKEHPFSGSFNGAGHVITDLKGVGTGLFNYVEDATIKDVSLGKQGKTCSLYNNSVFTNKAVVGGLVSYAQNSTISGCAFVGDFEIAVSLQEDGVIYSGGIVGWADSSTNIESCKVNSKITITSPAGAEVVYYAGGVAGVCEGSVVGCEMQGELKYSSSIATLFMGGIVATLGDGVSARNNTFNGSIILGGGAKDASVGGLYGCVENTRTFDYAQDKSISMGSIRISSYASAEDTYVYAGGMVGKALPGIALSFSGYENKTNFLLDQSAGLTSRYICMGGILGGCAYQDKSGAVASINISNTINSGSILVRYANGVSSRVRHGLLGGIVGFVNGPATIKDCSNSGKIGCADLSTDEQGNAGYSRAGATSNDFCEIIGGIAGYAKGGNMILDGCVNLASVNNLHYSNRPSTSTYDGMYCSQVAGGILGAFNFVPDPDDSFTLNISTCTNNVNGDILNFRGYAGGIVGFCRNATITGSSSRGFQAATTNDNAYYRGGIAGGVIKTNITDCWANCSINSGAGGSAEAAFSGGIVGWVLTNDPVNITDCKYFGTLTCTPSGTKPVYPGGIVSAATAKTTISNCKFGGSVQGTDISSNNVTTPSHVVGNYGTNPGCTIEGISYWDGKM